MHINPITLAVVRTLAGYSQAELSRRSGVSQGHISGIESGDKAASPSMILKLADALGAPIAALITEPSAAQIKEAKERLSKNVPATKAFA